MAEPNTAQLEKARELLDVGSSADFVPAGYSVREHQVRRVATALAEAAVLVSEAAEICAEMAREANRCAATWLTEDEKFGGTGSEADKATRYSAMADALREAERRIRARIGAPVSNAPMNDEEVVRGILSATHEWLADFDSDSSFYFSAAQKRTLAQRFIDAFTRARIGSAAPSLSQWQPIESAPKNDDDVLLAFENGDIEVAFWRDDAQGWDSSAGWIDANPTHWMPLPLNPKEEQA